MASSTSKFTSENIPKQTQKLPGSEQEMEPKSESTRLETPAGLQEYIGVGKLKGKKAIITGGDSGIGRAVAVLMAREGVDSTIVYLPDEREDAQETKEMIAKENRQCELTEFDLTDFKKVETIVKKHMDKFGALDILVNNASQQVFCKDFEQISLDQVESTFKSNILAMFAMAKYSLPHMKTGSSIINTTSVTAYRGSPGLVDYSSTKGAIVSFTRALAKHLGPKGIRVNAVAPGPVHTPLQPATRPPEEMENFGNDTIFERVAQPSEIAPSFVFLASAEAAMYTGQVLHPNGGDIVNG